MLFSRFRQDQIRVRLGEYDFNSVGETDEQTFNLAWMKMHENYDPKTFENDIALLKLDKPARFSNSVQPACLPPSSSEYTGVRATVTGWGTIYFGGPTSNILQEVDVGIWKNADCANNYKRLNRDVKDTMLCAGDDNGKDACQVSVNKLCALVNEYLSNGVHLFLFSSGRFWRSLELSHCRRCGTRTSEIRTLRHCLLGSPMRRKGLSRRIHSCFTIS